MVKNLPANAGDTDLIPGSGRSRMLWSNKDSQFWWEGKNGPVILEDTGRNETQTLHDSAILFPNIYPSELKTSLHKSCT